EAQGYGQLIEQFGYTQQDLAQVIGKSRSHVANTLRLLRLPQDVRDMLGRGELTAGHARTLITADDPAGLARRIVGGGLSVREAEALSQRGSGARRRPAVGRDKDADTVALESACPMPSASPSASTTGTKADASRSATAASSSSSSSAPGSAA